MRTRARDVVREPATPDATLALRLGVASAQPKKGACGACGKKPRKGTKRKRCAEDTCRKLVCAACWYARTSVCLGCYGMLRTPEEHLARIEERAKALEESLEAYEHACLSLWDDGEVDADDATHLSPTPYKRFTAWTAAIEEAAEALGLGLMAPTEPLQEFPAMPVAGADYDISALHALARPTFKVTKGGKRRKR